MDRDAQIKLTLGQITQAEKLIADQVERIYMLKSAHADAQTAEAKLEKLCAKLALHRARFSQIISSIKPYRPPIDCCGKPPTSEAPDGGSDGEELPDGAPRGTGTKRPGRGLSHMTEELERDEARRAIKVPRMKHVLEFGTAGAALGLLAAWLILGG